MTTTGITSTGVVTGEVGTFLNFMMHYSSVAGITDPSGIDNNGFPINTANAQINGLVKFPSILQQSEVLVIEGTGKVDITIGRGTGGFVNVVASGGAAVIGGTTLNLQIQCTTNAFWRVQFQFGTSVPSSITLYLNGSSGIMDGSLTGILWCRLRDEAVLAASTTPEDFIDKDYAAVYTKLYCGILRPMGWVNPNGGNVAQSRYIGPWRTSIFTNASRWMPGAWGGSTSGTNAYTCSAAPDASSGPYQQSEVLQVKFVNATTATGATINPGGRGVVPLFSNAGAALAANGIGANTMATLIYDAVLGGFIFTAGPQTPIVPYELQIAVVNVIGANYWCNFPDKFDDASVIAITTLTRTQLYSTALAFFEYANEIWNFTFIATVLAAFKGQALGFPSDNNRQLHGWYALRVRQIMALVTAAWSPRSAAQLKRCMVFQSSGGVQQHIDYRFTGKDLAPSGTNAGQGNATYTAITGGADYSQAPNRPLDYCDVFSYATYYSGGQLLVFDANYQKVGLSTAVATVSQASPGVLGFASAPNFLSGDRANLSGTGFSAGMTQLNNANVFLKKTAPTTFEMYSDSALTVPIDTSAFTAYPGSGGLCGIFPTVAGLLAWADQYNLGDTANQAAAMTSLDNDIRSGTGSRSGQGGGETLLVHASGLNGVGTYPQWNAPAVTFNKEVHCYEGGFQGFYFNLTSAFFLGLTQQSTITLAATGSHPLIQWNAHPMENGAKVAFLTTGALYTGMGVYNFPTSPGSPESGSQYYVVNSSTNGFDISLTPGGPAITVSGTQSGAHTCIGSIYADAGGRVARLLFGYKNNDRFRKTVYDQFKQFMSASKSVTPSWLLLPSIAVWACLQGDIYSAPFKSWDAQVLLNNKKRRILW